MPAKPRISEPVQSLQFWNAVALLLFALLTAMALWLIKEFGDNDRGIGLTDLAILALASFRLAHLFTDDKIFDFVRGLFFDRTGARLTRAERGWRRVACELVECLWCAGLWSALIVVTIYFLAPWGIFIDLLLAVAGAGAMLQLLGRAIAART
jgi:hypothetical protein